MVSEPYRSARVLEERALIRQNLNSGTWSEKSRAGYRTCRYPQTLLPEPLHSELNFQRNCLSLIPHMSIHSFGSGAVSTSLNLSRVSIGSSKKMAQVPSAADSVTITRCMCR